MLNKLMECDFDKHIEFAWELAQDQTKSGYPTYTDGIKTKQDFIAREKETFLKANEEILLFEQDGQVEGWIHYCALPQDNYLDLCVCNIRRGTRTALEEFLAYAKENFPGYELYLGFPKCNAEAISLLRERGFDCIDESFHDVLFLDTYKLLPEIPEIIPVTKENFASFRTLHDQIKEPMYWNSDRLLKSLDTWKIYLYEKNDSAAGAIYYMDENVMLEIFGVDFPDGVYNQETFRALLTKALNEGKRTGAKYFCFFTDHDSHPISLELGFRPVGQYVCYWKKI